MSPRRGHTPASGCVEGLDSAWVPSPIAGGGRRRLTHTPPTPVAHPCQAFCPRGKPAVQGRHGGDIESDIFPISARDPERLLTLLVDWHPVLLAVPPRCWHAGRVRRARGCAREVRVPALLVPMQGRRDKQLSASQMATGKNAKKNTMSWQRLSDCYTLRVHQ